MMKHLAAMAMAAAIALGIEPGSAHAQATSYPLVCKGGGDMFVEIAHDFYGKALTLLVNFRWSNRAASQAQPAPGHCAWLDRGGRLDEPIGFRVGFSKNVHVIVNGRGQIQLSSAGPESAPAVKLIQDIMAGRVFYLHAYGGASWLIVTRLGP
jgi:hypothetical protein